MDARYEKLRSNNRVISQGTLLILGVGEDDYRETVSVDVANTETERSWSRVFQELKQRGLRGVRLVVSDDHKTLKGAITCYFQGASWQRCQLHFFRSLLDHVAKKDKEKLAEKIQNICVLSYRS